MPASVTAADSPGNDSTDDSPRPQPAMILTSARKEPLGGEELLGVAFWLVRVRLWASSAVKCFSCLRRRGLEAAGAL
jgi:hypothetical protein